MNSLEKYNSMEKQSIAQKIQMLKESVYPRKRKSPIKSNSFKVLGTLKKIPTHGKVVHTEQQENFSPKKSPQQLNTIDSKKLLKRTNLQFESNKKLSSQEITTPWTVQNWMPAKTSPNLLKLQRIKQKQSQKNRKIICQSPQQTIQKKYQPRDAQSLLRKNSLFLLNFIKSKQKKSIKIAQIDNIPFTFDKIQKNKIPFEVIKTGRQERQKKFIQNLKTWKQQKYLPKHELHYEQNVFPEPW